jgi:hypothetical protein
MMVPTPTPMYQRPTRQGCSDFWWLLALKLRVGIGFLNVYLVPHDSDEHEGRRYG